MDSEDFFRIGTFQFENLIQQRLPFTLLDLRSPEERSVFPIHAPMARVIVDDHQPLSQALASHQQAPQGPVVVVCHDGEKSQREASRLVAQGYQNVFVLMGGTSSLVAD